MSRILIHDPNDGPNECLSLPAGKKEEVITCKDQRALVGALANQRPDVLVYVIKDLAEDLQLLTLLRQVAPTLPFILVGGPTDLTSRRKIQELKPTYYGVLPLERFELRDAVRGALQRGTLRR